MKSVSVMFAKKEVGCSWNRSSTASQIASSNGDKAVNFQGLLEGTKDGVAARQKIQISRQIAPRERFAMKIVPMEMVHSIFYCMVIVQLWII